MTDFEQFFTAATGHAPFRWQRRLYERLARGEVPGRCGIPTGLGKTSVIHVWGLALADQLAAASTAPRLPRRLVYIVDRRAVVDQATDEVEALLAKFRAWAATPENPALHALAQHLQASCCATNQEPFAVSTLRGQLADNRRWLDDPARPAVIVGTVDMLGSRLLFSGYGGLGRYSRSLHAGLLAQDALVVLDEAHLCPAFVETLSALEQRLKRTALIRPFQIMLLSATQPPRRTAAGEVPSAPDYEFALDLEEDRKDAEVAQRLDASKGLGFVSASPNAGDRPEDAHAAKMAEEAVALAGSESAVAVFADTVERVNRVVATLEAAPFSVPQERIVTLTGEMRGKERDELVEHPVFARFRRRRRDREPLAHPVFLVATAAAEVGINLDADHAVCDLVAFERMIQRLGRVNRFGDGSARVVVVLPLAFPKMPSHARELRTILSRLPQATDKEMKKLAKRLHELESVASRQMVATFRLLCRLPKPSDESGHPVAMLRNVSPAALAGLQNSAKSIQTACTPAPPCPPMDESRLDDWALTTLNGREFARPQVSYWLRGLTPDETPHTWLAWRADLGFAADPDDAAGMAETIPLAPAELVQVRTFRANDLIRKLRDRRPDAPVAMLTPAGDWTGLRLRDLPEKADERFRALSHATLVLPASLGGLKNGAIEDSDKPVPDAVDTARFRRVVLRHTADGLEAAELLGDGTEQGFHFYDSLSDARRKLPAALAPGFKFLFLSGHDAEAEDDWESGPASTASATRVAYFAAGAAAADLRDDGNFTSLQRADVPLPLHLEQTAKVARKLCASLHLPGELAEAVVEACARHDVGKKHSQWQKAIGNVGNQPLAKSAKPGFDHEATRGFRHEFLSLLEAADDPALAGHPRGDLILHLIAAHHGHARPGFSPEAYGILPLHARCSAAAREAAVRFARLQREYGWWQLAYLEALVKSADAIASRQADIPTP
jgi:CRISPR-associated endonuclease/helicase Cas3